MTTGDTQAAPSRGAASVPTGSTANVFYNTLRALHLSFLLPVVHFLPGRVDMPVHPDPERGR